MVDTIGAIRGRGPREFDEALTLVREAGTDNLSHFGCGYTHEGGLSLQQNPFEFAALLMMLVGTKRPVYLEIGSASGGVARMLHALLQFDKMFSIDDGGHHRYPELADNFRLLPMDHIKTDSHGMAVREWCATRLVDSRPDILFIDGDHSEAGVWQDIQLMRPYWHNGSLIILHDIVACDGVKKAWQRGSGEKLWMPLAEYIADEKPLGIGVGFCL